MIPEIQHFINPLSWQNKPIFTFFRSQPSILFFKDIPTMKLEYQILFPYRENYQLSVGSIPVKVRAKLKMLQRFKLILIGIFE